MRRLKRVAVRTEDPKVLDPVVELVAVDVVELDGDHAVAWTPHGPTADLALGSLEALREQTLLQIVAGLLSSGDEQLMNRCSLPPAADKKCQRRTEVRRIERELANASLDLVVVTAGRNQAELADRRRVVRRCSDRCP
jgi:hypothetical protein